MKKVWEIRLRLFFAVPLWFFGAVIETCGKIIAVTGDKVSGLGGSEQ